MKYYILKIQPEPIFPQVNCLSLSEAHRLKYGEFPNFEPELVFDLEPKAELTDVLSQAAISANGLLVNNRMKDIFEEFNIIDQTYFKDYIQNKGVYYYWMHLVASLDKMEWVDFPNSKFYINKGLKNMGEIELDSKEDYFKQKEKIGFLYQIYPSSLKLSKSFNSEIDIFSLPRMTTKIYISDKLKNILEKGDVTGVKIEEASLLKETLL